MPSRDIWNWYGDCCRASSVRSVLLNDWLPIQFKLLPLLIGNRLYITFEFSLTHNKLFRKFLLPFSISPRTTDCLWRDSNHFWGNSHCYTPCYFFCWQSWDHLLCSFPLGFAKLVDVHICFPLPKLLVPLFPVPVCLFPFRRLLIL